MLINSHLALVASAQFGLSTSYDCHVYALRAPEGILLIDAGSNLATDHILARLHQYFPQVPLAAILLTHAHPDHATGALALHQRTGCQIYAPDLSLPILHSGDEAASGLAHARSLGVYPPEVELLPTPQALPYSHNIPFTIAGQTFTPIHVPGHSPDIHCLLTELNGQRLLFSTDVLFYGAILGVINRPDSSMAGYLTHLHHLSDLSIDALLPGHGLFTLQSGQTHINRALTLLSQGFLPRMIGQQDLLF